MMHRPLNEQKRSLHRTRPVPRQRTMRARSPPRILLPVHNRQAVIRDVEASVLINRSRVRRTGDVERALADQGVVFECQKAGDQR